MTNVFIVKIKKDVKEPSKTEAILKRAQNSYEQNRGGTYFCKEKDAKKLYDYGQENSREGYILLVEYSGQGKINTNEIDNTEIERVYIGEASLVIDQESKNYHIAYEMKRRVENKSVIINLLDGIDLNFADDFDLNAYVIVSNMESLYKSIRDLITQPLEHKIKMDYSEIDETHELSEYAQHNNMCRRMYGILDEDENRSEFQRDRERIVNSKAFRRFEVYYKNPKLLHFGTLQKIYIDTLQNKNPLVSESAVDLLNGNLEIIRKEIEIITTYKIDDINDKENMVIFEKRKILNRNIADYISEMTDSYAMKEYNRICD